MKRIPLTQGEFAIVDDEDYEIIKRFKWSVNKCSHTSYVQTGIRKDKGKYTTLTMHRFLLNPPDGLHVDHRNGNGLDNRRSNIRLCTSRQNAQNRHLTRGRSQYKGVYWSKPNKKWVAQIGFSGKLKDLGSFANEDSAAKSYDVAAKKKFGDFARLNFPERSQGVRYN